MFWGYLFGIAIAALFGDRNSAILFASGFIYCLFLSNYVASWRAKKIERQIAKEYAKFMEEYEKNRHSRSE